MFFLGFAAFLVGFPAAVVAWQGSPHIDVMEVMGGAARTTQVLIRRMYRGGRNFDAMVGVDLTDPDEEHELYRYVQER